ncbi:MAG: cytochrome C [Legionellales bacterium RIFCSPHIGHO2_12_FULL_42_9]|nr:MAG: cytochrome C [Legionellales bacterium RIFCSPHIGHO2_12_FULL_42_9]
MLLRLCYLVLISMVGVFPSYSESVTHHPENFLASIGGKPDEGEQIVQHFCASCHAVKPLINLGAPRMGQKADWLPRVNQGLDLLFKHTAEGHHAMPPRGGCFECSDAQLKMAIHAMLPPTKSKDNKDNK